MILSNNEIAVINVLGDEKPALTLEEIHERTGISYWKLRDILYKLLKIGVISETKARDVIHIENEHRLIVAYIYDKI